MAAMTPFWVLAFIDSKVKIIIENIRRASWGFDIEMMFEGDTHDIKCIGFYGYKSWRN